MSWAWCPASSAAYRYSPPSLPSSHPYQDLQLLSNNLSPLTHSLPPSLLPSLPQAMEVLKLLADTPSLPPLSTRLLLYDGTSATSPFLSLALPPSSLPSCPLCSGQLTSLSACAAWANAHGLRGPGPSCPPSLPPSSLLPPEHEIACQVRREGGKEEGREGIRIQR